jgi:phenylalanyl-tRNA synthetase beta chain
MPTTEFSFRDLTKCLGKKYKPEEIRDQISMMGVDMERIDDEKIVMEIFPNRPDMLGVEGFARALKGVMELERGLAPYKVSDSEYKLFVDRASVKDVRPYIAAAVIKGVTITEDMLIALMNIQEKLHITHGRNRRKVAIGVHDMAKLTPPFGYRAAAPESVSFVPLDMTEKMTLRQILEGHPKGKAYAGILKDAKKYPLVLDSKENVLSMPPIINGELTRVNEKTKDLFIDITGTDRKAVDQALSIIVTSILDRCGKAYYVEIVEK